ncbi:MAG: arginine--tRNA ligase [Chloroflexi bacterium]|nr:arginine--tRNA ligase [Chloroflexota bacterium]
MTIKERVAALLQQAMDEAQAKGFIPQAMLPDVLLERPQNREHGDLASSLPLRLARNLHLNPMEIAQRLIPLIPPAEEVERVWVAPPGFINFALKSYWLVQQVEAVVQAGERYGNMDLGKGKKVQIEFVSVNPTGPLHVGHVRGGILGSTLANVLAASGYSVEREYYVNDAGTQMDSFYYSLYVRYQQALGKEAEMPKDGYVGTYMVELAREIAIEEGEGFLQMRPEEAVKALGAIGLQKMLKSIKEDLERVRVSFDVWFSERSLYTGGQYDKSMQILREAGYLTQREGALWFASTALGEDKDNVLVRSTGAPTYFASDIAYHYNKFSERGFDWVINIWGADHQGHVPRMKAMASALGVAPERLTLIISQLVTLRRGQEVVRASKRTGELVTLRELVDEVGPDACRFFFLSRSPESQMEFDLELAKKESSENPVYYVQYAHARIAGILQLAQESGIDYSDGDVSLLVNPAEIDLIRHMVEFPELIETMAQNLSPHHLPHYAMELATAFHWFYDHCRVVSRLSEEEGITKARLKLVQAARIVLARCLDLMGMDAPEKM